MTTTLTVLLAVLAVLILWPVWLLASALVVSAGPTTIRGAAVTLSATGGKVGGIVSSADLDPLTGLPLITFGMGSPTHLLSL